MDHNSVSRKIFVFFNALFLILLSLSCLLPFIHVLAVSFSSSYAAMTGGVKLWPVEFTTKSYEFVVQKSEFIRALGISFIRVVLGLFVNMFLTVLTAYPLAREKKDFRGRTLYVWIFVFTMLFSGGLIPWYLTIRAAGLINSIWALVLPGALPVFNVILLLNFFRGLPNELEESAFMDGAGHWRILWGIYIPLSIPALATILLFTIVGHWNSWFDGLILMNSPRNYPLQTYLQTLVIQSNSTILSQASARLLKSISDRTVKSAQIFLGALPVLLIYPFLQRYFMTGLVLGSVKE